MGMELLDQALVKLYRKGAISRESMFACCNDSEEVAKLSGEGREQFNQPATPVANLDWNTANR